MRKQTHILKCLLPRSSCISHLHVAASLHPQSPPNCHCRQLIYNHAQYSCTGWSPCCACATCLCIITTSDQFFRIVQYAREHPQLSRYPTAKSGYHTASLATTTCSTHAADAHLGQGAIMYQASYQELLSQGSLATHILECIQFDSYCQVHVYSMQVTFEHMPHH